MHLQMPVQFLPEFQMVQIILYLLKAKFYHQDLVLQMKVQNNKEKLRMMMVLQKLLLLENFILLQKMLVLNQF